MTTSKIIWTKTDEAPAMATFALLPVVQAFTKGSGIDVETSDISLTGRLHRNHVAQYFFKSLLDDSTVPTPLDEIQKDRQ